MATVVPRPILEIDPGPDGVERILVVTAHPDDVDFGAAGSVATWTRAGVEVAYCIVSDGDAGGSDRTVSRAEVAALRREEQRAAAANVGVSDVTFLGHPDGRVLPTIELRRDISRVIRQFRPERVVTQSPERNWERLYASHPDHLAAGEATCCAVYPDARNPFAHPELLDEGLEPHTVAELWIMATERANRVVDATDQFDRKLAALKSHRSQVGDGEHLEDILRPWMSGAALSAGLPDGRLAEAFHVVDTG
ncbi:MAG TPA: PIG-L deacetylase family protein [Acidimicrobiales bacterium]|nr:PIG-L deacetylase family protein [Acidimicrobiales bacterium]